MDIKFSKMDALKELVSSLIEKRLKELTLIPTVAVRDNYSVSEVKQQIKEEKTSEEKEVEEKVYEELTLDFTIQEEKKEYTEEQEEPTFEYRIKEMIPRGIVYLTYIIAENEDGMYIIDQHAAAERINYEKVLNSLKTEE